MKFSWVFATDSELPAKVDIAAVKNIGPLWGSWKTWQTCATDNVICHDEKNCQQLLRRDFQKLCNFYIPKNLHDTLKPENVQVYQGNFDRAVKNIEDIIALHLSSASSDVVLLVGFDFNSTDQERDRLGLMHSAIASNPKVQWVAVDHQNDFNPAYQKLPNLTRDKFKNVLKLLL